jgi:NAD-reducing hydrogenase small subunit
MEPGVNMPETYMPETNMPGTDRAETNMNGQEIEPARKTRLATAWLGGCSGCHMSFLDLDERLIDLFTQYVDLVYSPIADIKDFPDDVDIALVEGAVANVDHLELAHQIRAKSKLVVSFGDCAVTGNVTSLRNRLGVDDLLNEVYQGGPGQVPRGSQGHSSMSGVKTDSHSNMSGMENESDHVMPALLPRVLPLHQVIQVDAFITGCPPDPDHIWAQLTAIIEGKTPVLTPEMRRFG